MFAALLAAASAASAASAARCGGEPQLGLREGLAVADLGNCKVAWATAQQIPRALASADFVLSDDLGAIPFAANTGRLAFLERMHPMPQLTGDALDGVIAGKNHLLSVLLPNSTWDDQIRHIADQARWLVPEHTYVDDGLAETYGEAFRKYRFSLIVDDEEHTVSQAFIHCMGWASIPIFNGFSHLVAMLPRIILPWDKSNFRLEYLLSFLPGINEDIGTLWQQHRMVQDQLLYRYSGTFQDAFRASTCALCAHHEEREEVPLVFVGVYSAAQNSAKRSAVRKTWGRLMVSLGYQVRFFLGKAQGVQAEIQRHQDLVLLDVEEGYKWNSLKGLRFLEWCSRNVLARFLVKADDDVFLRPLPLLALLERRPFFGYVWGYFDYLSPVPREEGHDFYNSEEVYPFEAFPPYARGLLRVLSMDVVAALAEISDGEDLRTVFGDDPNFGVHLRYLAREKKMRLALDDRDSYRVFAMEPSCNEGLWSHVTHRTWVIHHVSPEQILCMWKADAAAGIYEKDDAGAWLPSAAALDAASFAADFATRPEPDLERQRRPAAELCACLAVGPLAEELARRSDKINASRTFMMWGHPSLLDDED